MYISRPPPPPPLPQISAAHAVSSEQRRHAWELVVKHRGESRPFCRSTDGKEGCESYFGCLLVDRELECRIT